MRFICRCSFLEIYKEVITDLLNPTATRLLIREDLKQGVHVEGLQEDIASSGQYPPHSHMTFFAWFRAAFHLVFAWVLVILVLP